MRKESVPQLMSFKVGNEVCDLDDLLCAEYQDIGEAAGRIPAAIGWMGYHKALAVERMIIAEHEWKEAEAAQYFALKNGGFAAKGFDGKITESALEKAVVLTPEVKAACEEYARRKRHHDWISASIDALKAKLELVRSSEATRRMEHEPDKYKGNAE